jgi:hypothetical protein
MAYYFMTASKDASVYLQQPNQNTGLDEILEVSKVYYGNIKDIGRALLKFDVGYLSASLADTSISMSEATLVLRETESDEIPLEYTIYANAVSGAWEMGNGTRFDNITTQGVTWNYREGTTNVEWLENGLNEGTTANPTNGVGGTWWINVATSQSFDYDTADINMDVSDLLRTWISGSIPNDGMILRFGASQENDTEDYGQLKFFSKETNTIYQPKIRIGWDDSTFSTGSLLPLVTEDLKVNVKNFKKEHKIGTNPKIKVVGRELYPVKTFSNTFAYTDVKYLPETTYYQIKDFTSDDIIVPFSEFTKISCDGNGNYFNLNLSNWEAGRVYKLEFKVDMGGNELFFDEDITFTIVSK